MTNPDAAWERERAIRRVAERGVRARLGGVKHACYRWVLVRARRRVRDRENLRFERTRVFGVVRRILLALGRHLAAAGQIAEPRDVFFLTRRRGLRVLRRHGGDLGPVGLAARRRAEFEAYAREPAPPDRFETCGAARGGRPQARRAGGPRRRERIELRGTGCCPGVVRAPVRVVRDPRAAGALAGAILVAERTDPGWTLLFPAARGLLVERGSLLSHSAIVAREIGLPCVVGIAGLLDTLVEGEEVEMDGTTGHRAAARGARVSSAALGVTERVRWPRSRRARRSTSSATGASGKTPTSSATPSRRWHAAGGCSRSPRPGDNALALLTLDPAEVAAVDLSAAQIACLELRIASFRELEHDERVAFLGVTPRPDRAAVYARLRGRLSRAARVRSGTRTPTGDRRRRDPRAASSSATFISSAAGCCRWSIRAAPSTTCCAPGSVEDQRAFYRARWDTWRWRALFRVFFSRAVMGRLGRDPEFFAGVEGPVADADPRAHALGADRASGRDQSLLRLHRDRHLHARGAAALPRAPSTRRRSARGSSACASVEGRSRRSRAASTASTSRTSSST